MAVSSTSNNTSRTSSSLDVAGIVSGLMEAENVPVTKLDAKISKSSVKITALGQIKSQLSALKSSLIDLQTPANFSKQAAKFSTTSVATAEFTATATAASYQMEVTTLAQPTIWNVSGFSTSASALAWYNADGQSSLRTAIVGADATVFQSTSGSYVLSLKSKTLGTDFSFNLSNDDIAAGITKPATAYQTATNAVFKLNGVQFTRSSNTVSDAITGVTLNLATTTTVGTPITLTVSTEAVSARPKLDALVKAYNDLYAYYKSQTASSLDAATRGVLNSDFGVSSMMRQLISGLMLPTKDGTGVALTGETDLSAMGLKLLDNGTLAVDDTLLASASSTLQTRLAAGIRIGYSSTLGSDLSNQIGNMILSGGVIQDQINSETSNTFDLAKRKATLQEKLVGVQARYTAQYASLDALLFKLQGTSDSLKSALDGLTNSQKNG
jgi:flagellar hook-associated protein 2